MTTLTFSRVNALPAQVAPSTLYIVKASEASLAEVYITGTDGTEVRHLLNKTDVAAMIAAAGGGGGGGPVTQLAVARKITATGDAAWEVTFDGSSDVSSAITLSNTGVGAGSYAVVTVDTKGRVTAGRALTAADVPALDATKISTGVLSRDTTGNAATATKLATARTINGVSFDGSANITIAAVDATARIASTEKGVANGVATLDATGKVPASQLPSYVDDIQEYVDLAALPVTGESGKIYVTTATNKIYRWSGSSYVEVTSGGGSATVLATARTIQATGDVAWQVSFDGSANASGAAALSATGVAAGTYPKVTVDAKGRVTAGAALVAADIPALTHTTVSSAGSVHLATADW